MLAFGWTHRWSIRALFAVYVAIGVAAAAPLSRWQPLDRNPSDAVGAALSSQLTAPPVVGADRSDLTLDPESPRVTDANRPVLLAPRSALQSRDAAASPLDCLPVVPRSRECSRE